MSATADRHEDAVARYFEAWNADDPAARAKAVAAAWTEDGTYTDPLADVSGHEGIAAVIAAAREQFPGFEFRLTGGVDGHHDIARFSWELVSAADGSAPVAGSDVIALDGQGRIRAVLGFLDRVPAGA
ncbi:nuclear transport factor 2 family protein [Streptomyces sp. NPDC002130]|uniref:nuclear transport factor 2 family protein n=1 Tax=Streptomyces sp. NPDC002130 TaxID=3155568 RepID=UPI0033321ADB